MPIKPTTQPSSSVLYRTFDRGLAAALMALGFELTDVERGDHEVDFVFPVSRMLLDAADAYIVDMLSVSAYRMGVAMEHIDDLVSGHGAEGFIDLDDL